MTQFAQCLCLDLTDTLACYIKFFSYFFQCARTAVLQTETQRENLLFTFCQRSKHFLKLFF